MLVFYLIIALAAPGALGAADIRLAGLLGFALGWRGWITLIGGALLGLLYGSLTGATMIRARRYWDDGPALCALGPERILFVLAVL